MSKTVCKLEIADILMNLLISRHSFSYITEKLAGKYFIQENDTGFSSALASYNSRNLNNNAGGESEADNVKSTDQKTSKDVTQLSAEPPGHCSLHQNFPNPFSQKTNINFQCSMSCFVSLKVYDIHWKEISTLVYEKQSPGTYQVEFDGSSLPEGVYFYRMDTENFSDTKKMFIEKK